MPKFRALSMLDDYGLQGGKRGPLISIISLIKARHDESVSSLFVFTLYFCERTVCDEYLILTMMTLLMKY